MTEAFTQFLRENLADLDEVGLNTLQAGLAEHDNEIAALKKDICEKQKKIEELNLANMNLNRTNIDLVLRMTGTEPEKTEEEKQKEKEDETPSIKEVIENWK